VGGGGRRASGAKFPRLSSAERCQSAVALPGGYAGAPGANDLIVLLV